MNFVVIFGPVAVGKMTVGQELEKITDLKLFHNHMTIEVILPYFDMKSPSFKKLVTEFRIKMFEEVAKSDLAGLIFTYVWLLDSSSDCDFINTIVNISPNRLLNKPSKNDFDASEKELLETDLEHILNSDEGEFRNKNHLKINNTELNAERVAEIIKERFGL